MMFFKRRRAPKPTFSAQLAPDEPFFAIGDIHGRADLLDKLSARMAAADPEARQVFVGDYIDRGEQSLQVLQSLQAVQAEGGSRIICLKGNHEEMLLKVLEDPASHGASWLRHGGLQTLASMGLAPPRGNADPEDWRKLGQDISDALGPSLIDWIKDLPLTWQSGNVCVLHAAADPALPIAMQNEAVLLWGHPDFETSPREDGTWIVYGHQIQDQPVVSQGRIGIDTGAFATGRLTAVHLRPGVKEPDFVQA